MTPKKGSKDSIKTPIQQVLLGSTDGFKIISLTTKTVLFIQKLKGDVKTLKVMYKQLIVIIYPMV